MPRKDARGLYPAIQDAYHGLMVVLDREDEADPWFGTSWIEEIEVLADGWECTCDVWRVLFGSSVPSETFRAALSESDANKPLPDGISVEPFGDCWIVRGARGDYWCEVTPNGCADESIEETEPLTFPTAALAKSAYHRTSTLYAERAARQKVAYATLGIADE